MSIKIHHGPPGSYKTSGAVMDDVPKAAREGRVLVTNVRGLVDAQKIIEVVGGDPAFKIIHVDTTGAEGLEKMRRWFHWAPRGAMLVVDEAQRVWPKSWRDSDLAKLDYPGGVEQAELDGRPANHWDAFDMHRHYNWDLVLTTPKITKIRAEIREAAEGAFKHLNRKLLGFGRSYNEAFHLAEDNGTSRADLISIRKRKIQKWVFDLYESTTTGEVRDTQAGNSFWRDPRVLALGTVVLVAAGVVLSQGVHPILGGSRPVHEGGQGSVGDAAGTAPADTAATGLRPLPVAPATGAQDRALADRALAPGGVAEPLAGWRVVSVGQLGVRGEDIFEVSKGEQLVTLSASQLERLGYTIQQQTDCFYLLTWSGQPRFATCRGMTGPKQESGSVLQGVLNAQVL